MSVSLDIVPLSNSLDVYGAPDSSSAYSLSGHVCISMNPFFSLFEPRRNILLRSLELTFEGQSEVVAPGVGYSAVRLCTVTRELVPEEGVELTYDVDESREPCRWNVVFNLPIPGWLPGSSKFGPDSVGTRYTLYASAKLVNLDDPHTVPWFSVLCSPFRGRQWFEKAAKSINVRRFVEPPSSGVRGEAPQITYSVKCKVLSKPPAGVLPPTIPSEIVESMRIIVCLPAYNSVEAHKIPLTLRLRAEDIGGEVGNRLRLTGFSVDVVQTDKCSSSPAPEYLTRFPVPGESLQPPKVPLRRCHPLGNIARAAFGLANPPKGCHTKREFSLLPAQESGIYKLDGDNHISTDSTAPDHPTWYTLETSIPFNQLGKGDVSFDDDHWAGLPVLRPTASGPLHNVQHEIRLSLHCTYELPDGEIASEKFDFAVPLRFAQLPPALPLSNTPIPHSPVSVVAETEIIAPALPPLVPYAQTLPVYSQLFYSNGDRKLDPTPLPLYTPRSPSPMDIPPTPPYDKANEFQADEDEDDSEDVSESSALLP